MFYTFYNYYLKSRAVRPGQFYNNLSNVGEPAQIISSVSCSQLTRMAPCLVFCLSNQSNLNVCCVFQYGILHTLCVTSCYLIYCCLSIIRNQTAHSHLTSLSFEILYV